MRLVQSESERLVAMVGLKRIVIGSPSLLLGGLVAETLRRTCVDVVAD